MNIKKKLEYASPNIEVLFLEMEQGIAAASANITVGEDPNSSYPQVEDWTERTESNDFRF